MLYVCCFCPQHKLAKQLVSYGFTLASMADCGGSTDMPTPKALATGEKSVNEALEILKEVTLNLNLNLNMNKRVAESEGGDTHINYKLMADWSHNCGIYRLFKIPTC
jgi:hypothetical protein